MGMERYDSAETSLEVLGIRLATAINDSDLDDAIEQLPFPMKIQYRMQLIEWNKLSKQILKLAE